MYSGTITSGSSDDWYALYKKPDTDPATIRVEDATVTGSTTCSSVIVTLDANDGTESALQSADLADNSAFTFSVPAEAASDPLGLYYLEVTDGGCIAGAPSYRIEPEPSTEWENPSAAPTGSVTADTSIGDASPPLQGNTSYPGTITSGTTDDWYELYKKTDADPATIRIADTTVEGATTCPSTIATLDANDGTESAIQSADLADNSAVTFAVPANAATDPSGLYYLEISNGDCVEGGDTYEIQPGPSSEWENPAQLPYESMPVGSSFAKAGGPLAGGVDYFSSIGSADSQNWNKFVDEGPGDAFATVEDPTTDQSTCQSLIVTLYNAADDAIASADLAGDSAVTFPVDTSGTYYLMADDGDCNPGPSPKTGEQVIVGPSNTVKTKAPSIPVVNCIVKGKSVVPPINQEVVKQVYLQTVGLHVSSTVQLSAFEAALVESDFNNCKNGHGTSAGVFQQINQYWGSYAQRTNVVAATNAYLKAAVNVAKAHPKYTAAQVAQGTQKSAYGSRYAAAATKAQEILNEARAKYASGS